jgi:VanZ family protein
MFFRYNLFTISWALVILFLVVMPGSSMPETDIWDLLSFDKLAHIFVFAVLTFLMIIGFTKQYTYRELRFQPVKYSLIICISYGIFLETIQSLSPGRALEIYDYIANTIGCFTGYGVFYIIYRKNYLA